MESALKIAVKFYGLDHLEWTLLKSYSNHIYESGPWVLQITPSSYKTFDELSAEVSWITYLNKNGLEVVKVVKSKDHNLLESQEDFTVICYEKIIGQKASKVNWNESYFTKLGKLTGQLHHLGQSFTQEDNHVFKQWDQIPKARFVDYIPVDARGLVNLYESLVITFHNYAINTQNYGLIHYDIHHENYFLKGEQEKIILFDFEMMCQSWYINEIAVILYYILNAIPMESRDSMTQLFLPAFIKGYREKYHLEDQEIRKIPNFLLYRDLLVYAYTYKIWSDGHILTSRQSRFRQKLEASISVRRKALG